jgi:rhodanese-related sulfurtransferase
LAVVERGALLVDLRSDASRSRDGVVPGALRIPRTVFEWRLAPESPWRNPHVLGPEQQILVFCDHGFSSVFAAATLVDLGYARAGDVVGGFAAWREAGLPIAQAALRDPQALPGMGPPDY